MKPVMLEAPIVKKNDSVCLPIANLSKALGVTPVQFKTNEILFKQRNAKGSKTQTSGTANSKNDSKESAGKAAARFVVENNSRTEFSTLSMGTPASVSSGTNNGTLVNQTIQGAYSGKTYSLMVKGNPADGGKTVYVTFKHGDMDKTGKLTLGEREISTTPVAVTLDSTGKAVLTYTVGTAPINDDAYDNDEITISDTKGMSAASYTNQISVLS
jgi:phospholipase C